MKTYMWEDRQLFNINKELRAMIDSKTVKTVISFSLISLANGLCSAILIYK